MKSTSVSFDINRRVLLAMAATAAILLGAALPTLKYAQAQTDPLRSWNEGASKRAITEFVARVTRQGGPDFVPPAERIATFDNDGTLWVEHPMYVQMAFVLDRVKALAPLHPEWRDTQPFKAVLEGDMKTLAESGEHGLLELGMATHAGMTTEEFEKIVTDWLATARDARFKRPYTELSYLPMIELLISARQRVQDLYCLGRRRGVHAAMDRAGLRRAAGTSRRLVDQDQVPDARR
jgi:hypothetical protein